MKDWQFVLIQSEYAVLLAFLSKEHGDWYSIISIVLTLISVWLWIVEHKHKPVGGGS